MIPSFAWRAAALVAVVSSAACGRPSGAHSAAPSAAAPSTVAPSAAAPSIVAPSAAAPSTAAAPAAGCLTSGDGYLRANLGGAVEAHIDWPNSGTQCEGESRGSPPGVRLSFRRDKSGKPDLLLVFGLTGVQPGAAAHEVAANVTVIVQGTTGIYGTLGDARCTVDSLQQRPLAAPGAYRIEARGFCTQPAHAVRGSGDVLVSTFEFAGPVTYVTDTDKD